MKRDLELGILPAFCFMVCVCVCVCVKFEDKRVSDLVVAWSIISSLSFSCSRDSITWYNKAFLLYSPRRGDAFIAFPIQYTLPGFVKLCFDLNMWLLTEIDECSRCFMMKIHTLIIH